VAKRVIFFDCMETLIDMYELPGEREYALWAYVGSGVEEYWEDQAEFIADYRIIRQYLRAKLPPNKEYDIHYRYKLVVEKKIGQRKEQETKEIVDKLIFNYWNNYKARCYVSPEVADTLSFLAQKKYKMAVVSNFLVQGGIQELLSLHGLDKYIQSSVTSVDVGWRKPHSYIYEAALLELGVEADKVIFIGDDYQNDYLAPQKMGFKTLFYDPQDAYPHINRFITFEELRQRIFA
jgi:putative hydrolase of the HAD superfamily